MNFDENEEKIYEFLLTKGEIRAFDKLYAIENAHNVMAKHLTLVQEQFIAYRNDFIDELCRKYSIPHADRGKITFDRVSKRFVSRSHPGIKLFVEKIGNLETDKYAAAVIQTAIKELIQVYLATDSVAKEHVQNG